MAYKKKPTPFTMEWVPVFHFKAYFSGGLGLFASSQTPPGHPAPLP
jgi:hypothetical protein